LSYQVDVPAATETVTI